MISKRAFLGALILSPLAALAKPMLPKPFDWHAWMSETYRRSKLRKQERLDDIRAVEFIYGDYFEPGEHCIKRL